MEQKVIKDSLLGEYTYAVLDNSLKVFLMEKPMFSGAYAIFGTRYGSIDTKFSKNGEQEISVPEGIAHFLEHKLFESEDGDAFTKFAATGAYANAFTSVCFLKFSPCDLYLFTRFYGVFNFFKHFVGFYITCDADKHICGIVKGVITLVKKICINLRY